MCVASDLVPYIARENPSDTRIFFDATDLMCEQVTRDRLGLCRSHSSIRHQHLKQSKNHIHLHSFP